MIKKLNALKNQKGMTLVELLAVMVIIGIIAAISIPAIGNLMENSRKDAHIANAVALEDAARLYVTSNEAEVAKTLADIAVGTVDGKKVERKLTFSFNKNQWSAIAGGTTVTLSEPFANYLDSFVDPHTKDAYVGATVTVTDTDGAGNYTYSSSLTGAKVTVGEHTEGVLSGEKSASSLKRDDVKAINKKAPATPANEQ